MAELNIGDVVAKLKLDASEFVRSLQAAQQAMQQFAQSTASVLPAVQRLQQAGHQAGQGFQQLASQVPQANQALTQTSTTITQTTTSFTQLLSVTHQASDGAARFGSVWHNALAVAGGLGIVTSLQAATRALLDFGQSVVETGARMESLRASLSAIGGSVQAGIRDLQFLTDTALRLGVPLDVLARGYRTLTAAATQAGLPLADQQRLLVAVATEARRVGASSQEVERAFLSLAQSAGKNKISMEEVRQQFGEAIPTSLGATARGLGLTTEAFTRLVETGNLTFVPYARAVTRGFEELGRSAQQTGQTTQQALNNLSTAWTQFKDVLFQSGVQQYVTNFVNSLKEAVDLARNLVKAVGGAPARPAAETQGLDLPQRTQLATFERLIASEERQPRNPPEYLQRLTEARDQLLEVARATQAEAEAQQKVTDETSRTAAAADLHKDTVDGIRKSLEEMARAQEAFRARARLTPEVLGRPSGTPEEQTTYLQGQQQALRPQLEKLAEQVRTAPPGVTIPPEVLNQVKALDAQYGILGKSIDALRDKEQARQKAEREAEAARQKALREEQQDQERRQSTIDQLVASLERQREQDLKGLDQIISKYRQTQEAREADTVAAIQQRQVGDALIQQRAQKALETLQDHEAYVQEVDALKQRYVVLKANADAQRDAEAASVSFTQKIQQEIDLARASRQERPEVRLRAQAEREQIEISPEQESMLARLTVVRKEQAALNQQIEVFRDITTSVGSAWANALSGIADGTKTVSQAFREMARSILQSLTQIASQQAFKALLELGTGILTGSLTTAPATEASGAVGSGINPILFQHGGQVNRPTFAMLGEGPSSTLPETVLNRPQLEALLSRAPSAGGQAVSAPTVILVDNRQQADAAALRERARGKDAVIVNAVLGNLAQGESSSILRAVRTLQR